MAFKIGSSTVIDNGRNVTSGTANGTAAFPTGFNNSGNNDIGSLVRFSTYVDIVAANCRGYLPTSNCLGNPNWVPPDGNWWTWGVGVNCVCGPGIYDGTGGRTNCNYNAIPVNFVYDGYVELLSRVRGSELQRNYSNCNCGTSGTSDFGTNNNCNCACACVCDCDCTCACACDCACACNC